MLFVGILFNTGAKVALYKELATKFQVGLAKIFFERDWLVLKSQVKSEKRA